MWLKVGLRPYRCIKMMGPLNVSFETFLSLAVPPLRGTLVNAWGWISIWCLCATLCFDGCRTVTTHKTSSGWTVFPVPICCRLCMPTVMLDAQKNDHGICDMFENWPIHRRLCHLNFRPKNIYVLFPILDYSQLSTDCGFITITYGSLFYDGSNCEWQRVDSCEPIRHACVRDPKHKVNYQSQQIPKNESWTYLIWTHQLQI